MIIIEFSDIMTSHFRIIEVMTNNDSPPNYKIIQKSEENLQCHERTLVNIHLLWTETKCVFFSYQKK